ncbi:putative transcription factor AS2-LOB family [Medicago truncatula]|uniref:LOB domain protein n=1 Tax=Medicago truncatula TaxID=3880 RepID=A0A072UBI4_MEDTR|nr:LOB domain-containing protein 42 [Medicago truncatula]KEH26403.1 LOB domain protein [Medicago truncatula]RHN51610.1 putative transcription factor AS2-LOB family [Medicago truncatula]
MKLSCNGCRVLRKGCNDDCIIKPCLEWISSSESQGRATLFLTRFYGRIGLLNLLTNATNQNQNPQAVFKSLLYEASGRLVNPTYGVLGLFWTGDWSRLEAAVEAVLTGSNINDNFTMIDGQTSSGTVNAENHVLPKTYDIRHVAKGTNVDIKGKTQFKRAGKILKPKPRVGSVDSATMLKSLLNNTNMEIGESSSRVQTEKINEAAENQVNLELTLGFDCHSTKSKKILDK